MSERSFLSRVRHILPDLSPAERKLGELVRDFPGELASFSASELADLAAVSNATVSRFVRRLGYASLPKGKGPRSSYFNWGWSYVIANSALSPELAYLFCALGVSAETSTRAVQVRDGYFDPFMPQHYEDPMIRDVYSDEFLKVHRAAMETAGLRPGPETGLGPRGINHRGDPVFGPLPFKAIIYMGVATKAGP